MKYFSIKEVSLSTGLNPITLRAWEARYGILDPERTEGGHRMYSEEDIKRIKVISLLRSNGHSLKEIPKLLKQFELTQNDIYQYTIPNLIQGLKSLDALKVQKLLAKLLSQQTIECFADKTLHDILQALKKELWADSLYFTQERCFFYDQLRFQLQCKLYQNLDVSRPIEIKIVGFNAPKQISEFYVQVYLLALLCIQYHFSVCVISHIDSFDELVESCLKHKEILHIAAVGCDEYQLLQIVELCKNHSYDNLLIYHPTLGQISKEFIYKQYLLPRKFEDIPYYLNQYSYTK